MKLMKFFSSWHSIWWTSGHRWSSWSCLVSWITMARSECIHICVWCHQRFRDWHRIHSTVVVTLWALNNTTVFLSLELVINGVLDGGVGPIATNNPIWELCSWFDLYLRQMQRLSELKYCKQDLLRRLWVCTHSPTWNLREPSQYWEP